MYYIRKVDVEDVRYTEEATEDYSKKLELDITPYFQVAAALRGIADIENPEDGEAYVILSKGVDGADEDGWIEIPVSYPVEMFIPMPAAFATNGDETYLELWFALMMLSMMGMSATIAAGTKRRKDNCR